MKTIDKKYSVLIGHSGEKTIELHNIQEVAEFICNHGLKNDLLITQPDGTHFLDTFGIFINHIADMEYRDALVKILTPMQIEL